MGGRARLRGTLIHPPPRTLADERPIVASFITFVFARAAELRSRIMFESPRSRPPRAAPWPTAVLVALGTGLVACAISRPIEQQHPSVQRLTPSADDSDEARRATALETAARDMACPRVEIALTLERRYANTATARYAIEGCGKRALYAETCEDYPRCRYLMLSVMPVPGAPPAP